LIELPRVYIRRGCGWAVREVGLLFHSKRDYIIATAPPRRLYRVHAPCPAPSWPGCQSDAAGSSLYIRSLQAYRLTGVSSVAIAASAGCPSCLERAGRQAVTSRAGRQSRRARAGNHVTRGQAGRQGVTLRVVRQ
jgi:hypothetical protein